MLHFRTVSSKGRHMTIPKELQRISEACWMLPPAYKDGMLVPALIYGTERLINEMENGVFEQVSNVATLPGIVRAAFCMPDGHWGYGFPIGGVAAFDAEDGVISPGGIGFDINCGMRLVTTNLRERDVKPRIEELINQLYRRVPAGVGGKGLLKTSHGEFRRLVEQGARWCVERGYGWEEDLELTEHRGCLEGADSKDVSDKAVQRGHNQVGTLGSGNHYLEIQVVREKNIYDRDAAEVMGITMPDQVVVMFHCGSRGFGHQVATGYLRKFLGVMTSKYGIPIRDRELACAPVNSPEGSAYFSAMKCAVNMAFANRQVILHRIREVFADVFGSRAEDLGMHQVYDVSHNTAKIETHEVNGEKRKLLVHRKGATRAFAPGMEDVPAAYKRIGQPVIIGGSMETGSYLLVGRETGAETFFSTCHGSGRVMSRRAAKRTFRGEKILQDMRNRGIYVRAVSMPGLAEEAGGAYKDVDDVVLATEVAGLTRRVVRFEPIGNVKG